MTKWRHTLIAIAAGLLILGGSAASARAATATTRAPG